MLHMPDIFLLYVPIKGKAAINGEINTDRTILFMSMKQFLVIFVVWKSISRSFELAWEVDIDEIRAWTIVVGSQWTHLLVNGGIVIWDDLTCYLLKTIPVKWVAKMKS